MRIESVALEYHSDVSVLRLYVIHLDSVDEELSLGDVLEAGDHTQSCGLSASGRSYEDNEFLIFYFEIEIVNSVITVLVDLLNVF